MSKASYEASPIKKRKRRTKAEMEALRQAIYEVCEEHQPLTVRQAFYRLVAAHAIEKTQAQYGAVGRLLVQMRRSGVVPFHWIVDNTRWMRKPTSYSSLGDMLARSRDFYRRALWEGQDVYVEVWCESDSVSGVLYDVTSKWDVPLMPARGFSSWTFCNDAAEVIQSIGKPTFIYYFGDYDPSGVFIDSDIENKLTECGAEFTFTRLAVTAQQIDDLGLVGRPPKSGDKRAKKFKGDCVELEAIAPGILRNICEQEIVSHIDMHSYTKLLEVEAAERETLSTIIDGLEGVA